MDHGLSIERRVRDGCWRSAASWTSGAAGHQRLPLRHRDAAQNHEALLCVQTGKTLSDPDPRFKFDGDGYPSPAADMRAIWGRRDPGGLRLDVADRRAGAVLRRRLGAAWTGCRSSRCPRAMTRSWLRHEVHAGLRRRSRRGAAGIHRPRRGLEIDVICGKGFPSYFLIVADLINHARSIDIRVGPGRGSAAGSLVAYALGITNIDPIRTGLLFERFLNPNGRRRPTSTSTSTTAAVRWCATPPRSGR